MGGIELMAGDDDETLLFQGIGHTRGWHEVLPPPTSEGFFSLLLSQSNYSIYVDLRLIRINRISLATKACARFALGRIEVIRSEMMAR